jgi:catechol 2,3-dioxygenase-like lactoylglutathione lyase family enzyme
VKLLGLIFAVTAMGADLKVDHITVAGSDLAALRGMFAKAGIETEYGGKHSNGSTEMALASFPDGSYLELIAPQPGHDASAHYWGPFMLKNGGPCAWAITSADIAADERRLKGAGIAVQSTRNGRVRPDGVELKWETANVGPGSAGSFFPFLIHDETPRERRVYPSGKPTSTKISGVEYVVIAVRDLKEAVAKYRAAFGLGEATARENRDFGGTLAYFPDSPVILATGHGWIAERLKQFGEAPCAFVLDSEELSKGKHRSFFVFEDVRWINPGGMRIGLGHYYPR